MASPTRSPLVPRRLWADDEDSDDSDTEWWEHTLQQWRKEECRDVYDRLGRNSTAQERRQEMQPWVKVKKDGRSQKAKFEDVYFEAPTPKRVLEKETCVAPVSLVAERTEHAAPSPISRKAADPSLPAASS